MTTLLKDASFLFVLLTLTLFCLIVALSRLWGYLMDLKARADTSEPANNRPMDACTGYFCPNL